jgi:acyl carrier protein
MTKNEFLRALEQQMDLTVGSLEEGSALSQVDGWDSMAPLIFMALADERLHITLSADEVNRSKSVSQLLALLGNALSDAR